MPDTQAYQRQKKRFDADPGLREKHNAYQRAYFQAVYAENLPRYMWSAAKSRAKQKGLEFSITRDDIVVPHVCPVLGIPLIASKGRTTDSSPTLDRVDSQKGYQPGNVRVISMLANRIKNNGTASQILTVALDLLYGAG